MAAVGYIIHTHSVVELFQQLISVLFIVVLTHNELLFFFALEITGAIYKWYSLGTK